MRRVLAVAAVLVGGLGTQAVACVRPAKPPSEGGEPAHQARQQQGALAREPSRAVSSSLRAAPASEPDSGVALAIPESAMVERAEADLIRVRELMAVTLEVDELEVGEVVRGASNPTPKNVGWGALEGRVIEVDRLVAHHVRARHLIAERITVRSIDKLKQPVRGSARDAGSTVRNRCVDAREGTPSEACFRESPF